MTYHPAGHINHVWNEGPRTRQLYAYNDLPGLRRSAQAEADYRGRSYRVPPTARRHWLIIYLVKLEQVSMYSR